MDEADGGCFGKIKEDKNDNPSRLPPPNENNNAVEAYMPVDQHDENYNMAHRSRGVLLIFNHENFDPSTQQNKRSGTDEDVKKITQCFDELGFEIRPYKDLTVGEIKHCMWECIHEDHNDRDCLAIFVLSHGDKDMVFARDHWYNPAKELWGNLSSDKCPSLAGKPKLIFLQPCQGKDLDQGIQLMLRPLVRTEFDSAMRSYSMPVYADFLIVYATFEGFFAFRNDVDGSKWVTILCQVLQKNYRTMDIQTMLTHVNRRLAVDFTSSNSKDKSKDGLKQISYFKSSLTRILVFGEKLLPSES